MPPHVPNIPTTNLPNRGCATRTVHAAEAVVGVGMADRPEHRPVVFFFSRFYLELRHFHREKGRARGVLDWIRDLGNACRMSHVAYNISGVVVVLEKVVFLD